MFCNFALLEQKCSEYEKSKTQEQTQSLADKIKSAQQKADNLNQNREYKTSQKRDKEQEH